MVSTVEEVNGQQGLAVRPDELAPPHLPALACRFDACGPEPRAHRRRGDRDAKPFQFADNPWIAPAWVLAREPQHPALASHVASAADRPAARASSASRPGGDASGSGSPA